LIITSGISRLYSQEAISLLDSKNTGILNLVTTYPLPKRIVVDALKKTKRVLFSEEIDPFVEDEVRSLAIELDNVPELH